VRRDPMAMLPFCGYNYGDYWAHWLSFGEASSRLPKIFHVNWFRKNKNGKFMWPGFGENMRVLDWIIKRCSSQASAVQTPIGLSPGTDGLNLDGVDVPEKTMQALLAVDKEPWLDEISSIQEYLASFGDRTPEALIHECQRVASALQNS